MDNVGKHQITDDGNYKQIAEYWYTYPDGTREKRKGLVLGRYASVTGTVFIAVDNYANRILISDVISVIKLNEVW